MKVIDALVITLGLDSSEFKKGSKEMTEEMKNRKKEAEKLAKDMEAAGKKTASFFSSIKTELLALAGVTLTLGGLKSLVTSTTDSLSKLGYAAQNLGMSGKELDGWQKAFAKFGVGADQVRGSMAGLQNDLALLRNKGEISQGLITLTGRMGINLQDEKGAFKSVQDLYLELADRFKNMEPATRQMYGRDVGISPEMVNMLSRGSQSVQQDVLYFTNISNATNEATQKAQHYEQKLSELGAKFDATKQKIVIGMMPALEQLNRLLDRFGDWVNNNSDKIVAFFSASGMEIGAVAEAVGGWQNAMAILLAFVAGKWVVGMVAAIASVSASVAGLVTSLASVAVKNPWLLMLVPANNTPNQTEEMNELEKLKRDNWAKNNPGVPYPEAEPPAGEPVQHAQSARASGTRGARNNNPGNLEFRGQRGAVPEQGEGRFAAFQTMGEGVAALYRQLMLYFKRGKNTIAEIVNTYAPASDGNDVNAYIKQLTGATGKSATEALNPDDINMMAKLIRGIVDHESGRGQVDNIDLMRGIQLGAGVAIPIMPTNNNQTSTSTETHIGHITVNTQANDARGIVLGLQDELRKSPLMGAFNGAIS